MSLPRPEYSGRAMTVIVFSNDCYYNVSLIKRGRFTNRPYNGIKDIGKLKEHH